MQEEILRLAFRCKSANLFTSPAGRKRFITGTGVDNRNIRYHRREAIWKKLPSSESSSESGGIARSSLDFWPVDSSKCARVMGRSNNSSNLPTQFYWISSRQLLLALLCRLPLPRHGFACFICTNARGGPASLRVQKSAWSQRSGRPIRGLDTHVMAAGSSIRMSVVQ